MYGSLIPVDCSSNNLRFEYNCFIIGHSVTADAPIYYTGTLLIRRVKISN